MSRHDESADLAGRIEESGPLKQPVPSQVPTTETETPIFPETPPLREGPPVDTIAGIKWSSIMMLMVVLMAICWVLGWGSHEVIIIISGQNQTRNVLKQSGKCVLPAYPDHGTYMNAPAAKPGESLESLNLTVICLPGYGVLGTEIVFCSDGLWSDSIPKCVRFCKLDNNTSVRYHCFDNGSFKGRACDAYEPSGTVVRPECNSPNYYAADTLRSMRCIDGSWDHFVVCSPECGRITPKGETLMFDGRSAEQGELPWHVGIYRKNTKPYRQICGGSIISNRHVISAAHCFWSDVSKLLPASNYSVAAGKIYRPWNNPRDVHAQKADVKEIKIPARFQGSAMNFQDDIAVIILEIVFIQNSFVRPICLDFDVNFDRRQLQPGKLGKVAGWGLTAENGKESQILRVVELPYVDIEQCIAASQPTFIEYITSDKMCAGSGYGKALCRGDSGGGLAFPESERGTDRYYLRGIVSTAATDKNNCTNNTVTAFTQILIHEHFIREYLGSGQTDQQNA